MKTQATNTTTHNFTNPAPWRPSEEAGKLMNKLIRGEKAAVEAMSQVIGKLEDSREIDKLESMRNDHRGYVSYFTTMAIKQGKVPEKDSGPWGTFVELFMDSAQLFGNKAALNALKQGHEHGINEYKDLLKNDEVPQDVKTTVRTKIIPQIEGHITSIEEMNRLQ